MVLTVTPANGVSTEFDTTARPINDVVGAITASDTADCCVTGMPSPMAEAVIDKFEVAIGWPAGALRVRTAVCPVVMEFGLRDVVTPAGAPVTMSDASCVNPFELLRVRAYVTL